MYVEFETSRTHGLSAVKDGRTGQAPDGHTEGRQMRTVQRCAALTQMIGSAPVTASEEKECMMNRSTRREVRVVVSVALAGLVLFAVGEAAAQFSVEWGTYLGGTGLDEGDGIVVDVNGTVYATGETESLGWVIGGWDTVLDGTLDGYVVALDAQGGHLWSTFFGGAVTDGGGGIAVDGNGGIYVAGTTKSPNWISGGWDTILDGNSDSFVVKLGAGGAPLWSTYVGGTASDYGIGVRVDGNGNVYTSGWTSSPGWVGGGWDTSYGDGGNDGYVVKLDSSGSHVWSTYVGGSGYERGYGIMVDTDGNAYAVGYTGSSGWTSGGWDTILDGPFDGYVVKLDTTGAHLWSSYVGGASEDYAYGIAVDSAGNVYTAGCTNSAGWVSGGWDMSYGGGVYDGYMVKLDMTGAHLWSTYLGGTDLDISFDLALDTSQNVYVSGSTASSDWVGGGWDTSYGGGVSDGYVVKLDPVGVHVWSSYVGGASLEYCWGIALDSNRNIYLSGQTESSDWLMGGWDTSYDGSADGYVVKIAQPPDTPTNPGATDVGTNTITWTWHDNSVDETGFKVYADPGAGPPVTLQTTTAANVQSWPYNGLNENTQYAFQVCATNVIGDSALTPSLAAWTLAATPIAPIVSNPGVDSLDVVINGNDGNSASTLYAIMVNPPVGGYVWVQADGTVGMNPVYQTVAAWGVVTVTGLEQGTEYSFQAIAQNGAGVDTIAGAAAIGSLSAQVPVTGPAGWAAAVSAAGVLGALHRRRRVK